MSEKSKSVTLNGHEYLISKMTPKDACWVFLVGRKIASGDISKEEFAKIQTECLRVVNRVEQVGDKMLPVAIITPDGRFVAKDLEDDAPTVFALTLSAMEFNTGPFLAVVESLEAAAGKSASPPSSSPK